MDKNIPTEKEITDLLRQMQPTPSAGYHQKMAKQAWMREKRVPLWSDLSLFRRAAAIGVVLLIVLGISLLSPSLNTVAQRFTQFFLPSPDSHADWAIAPLETSHPTERFNLTISEAEDLAGFKMVIPSSVPAGFVLKGAAFDALREAIILHYTTDSKGLVLRISQQQIDSDYQAIGPEAVVEKVAVGRYGGEYVGGGWMIPEVESGLDATQSPNTPQVVWDENVNLQTLRWSDGEYLYEIILAGSSRRPGYLDKDGLVALANGMY